MQQATIETRVFGTVGIDPDKVITFPNGIIGFPDMKNFLLLYNIDRGAEAGIRWLQSIEEPNFALPVMDPLLADPAYNPEVEDDLLKPIGELTDENLFVLVSVTIPSDITQMTVNLKAPIVINTDERKACQIIAEGDRYQIKTPIYEIIKASKKAGE